MATKTTWRDCLQTAQQSINNVGEWLGMGILNILLFLLMRNPLVAMLWAISFPGAYSSWFANDEKTRSISGWVIKRLGWKVRIRFVRTLPEYFSAEDQVKAWREDPSLPLSVEAEKELVSYPSDADMALLFERKDYDLIAKIMMKKTIGEMWVRTLLARAEEDPKAKSLAIFAARQYGISQKLLAEVINNKGLDEGLKKSVKYASSVHSQRLVISNGLNNPSLITNMAKDILPEAQSAMILGQYLQFKKAGCCLDRIAILERLRGGANKYTAQIFKNEPKEIFNDPEIRATIENDYMLIEQYYA